MLSDHYEISSPFSFAEFTCRCGCGTVDVDKKFLAKLEMARQIANIPFIVTSGTRCIAHNNAVGGVDDSAHLPPTHACDIYIGNSSDRYVTLISLIRVGFKRIGIGVNFIHVDDDMTKPDELVWVYNNERKIR